MQRISYVLLALVVILCATPFSHAEIRLAGIFGEHMVLQRQKEIKIWGWADAGESVHISLANSSASAKADKDGKWSVSLPAMEAGGPHTLTAGANKSNPTIRLNDILIGEVWLCSGQSNMEWSVAQSKNAQQEIAAANHPKIRHFNVNRRPSAVPLDDVQSQWTVCSPQTVPGYTATGYYFARKLQQELGVPIGLINSSWGGTRVEPWTPVIGFGRTPALSEIYQSVLLRTPGTQAHQRVLNQYIATTEQWIAAAKDASRNRLPITPAPTFPAELLPAKSHQSPTMLYNGMIHGIVGIPMRGAIWYQGESNRADGMMYYEKKKALINGWREIWGQGDFPFYFVQIAPFQYGNDRPDMLAELWEAQSRVLELPNTGMVVISDVGNLKDIHPRNKQAVGLRLANVALKNDYGESSLLVNGPTFQSLEVRNGELAVTFGNTGTGLKSRDGNALNWFEIIGKGTQFEKANARIDGDKVILSSPKVPKPVAVRFAWHKLAEPNLTNSVNLPAVPFRAGEVPTALESIPDFDQYQLVYDLDLAQLGNPVKYQKDLHDQVGKFDRVAYFLELKSDGETTPRHLFVSMDAFTDDASKIGVPTFQSKASFESQLNAVEVHSNVDGVKKGRGMQGFIEFWPNNYEPRAGNNVGGSKDVYDFDDSRTQPENGYGSMQVHLPGWKQTLFALNRWGQPQNADLGIGNAPNGNPDWTFAGNIGTYTQKRLRVFVRPTSKDK